ncbi:MAG: class I SAM-dependent methyltransferase [Candidatus Woesearchaeota archaeon]|nr:class I SAM-dependent methyltransferase [Candidatus Woesearchaeota archaeon]
MKAEKEKDQKCVCCGSLKRRFFASEKGFDYFKCRKCALVYVNPLQVGRRETFGKEDRKWMSIFENADRKRFFSEELREIDRLTGGKRGKLLDVGCGEGEFMELAKKDWWQVYGIEPAGSSVKRCQKKKLNVEKGFFPDDFRGSRQKFDAITMFDVLEHMHHPKSALFSAGKLLKEGGLLVVRVPNPNYVLLKRRIDRLFRIKNSFGKEATYFNPGSHIFYFYPKTIKGFIERSGFSVLKVKYERSEIFLDNKTRVLAGMLHFFTKALYYLTFGRINCIINTAIYARKGLK